MLNIVLGPAEVTVFLPEIFIAIDGPRSECIKGEMYDLLESADSKSLVTMRDKQIHASRRRDWSAGFTSKALRLHLSKRTPHLDQLDQMLMTDAMQGRTSNFRDYIYWYGFDVMGEFVFGRSFDMLKNQDEGQVITRLQNALSLLGPLSPAPWLLQIGLRMPRVSVIKDWYDTLDWCRSQMQARLQVSNSKLVSTDLEDPHEHRDLAYYLMEAAGKKKIAEGTDTQRWNLGWLVGDSLLAIVAGRYVTLTTLLLGRCID